MGIKARFTQADVRKMIKEKTDRIESALIARLQYIGEAFVNNARNNGAYLDHTGNLRSSIGYVILRDGKVLFENYQLAQKGTDKTKGMATGKKLVKEVKAGLSKGYVLIVVAGMDYAASVESMGKDVLTASSIIAKKELQKAAANFKNSLR
jgi:hypothetical protein